MATALAAFSLTTTRQRLFDSRTDGGRCRKFFVAVLSTSPCGILINVPGLHKAEEWVGVPIGSYVEFEIPSLSQVNGITDIFAYGDGDTAVIDGGVLSKYDT